MQCKPKPQNSSEPIEIEHWQSGISTNIQENQTIPYQIFHTIPNPLEASTPLNGKKKKEIKKNIKKMKLKDGSKIMHHGKRKKIAKVKDNTPPTPYNTTEYICYNQSFTRLNDFPLKTSIYPTLFDLDPLASLVTNSFLPIVNSNSNEPTENDDYSNSLLDFKQEEGLTEP